MNELYKTKLIQCPCNNNIIVYAHTERSERSAYGFKSTIEVSGIANLDHFQNVLCVCGKVHNIKRFANLFHAQAVKHFQDQPAEYPMIEGKGAPQYCFDLPAEPTQLALL